MTGPDMITFHSSLLTDFDHVPSRPWARSSNRCRRSAPHRSFCPPRSFRAMTKTILSSRAPWSHGETLNRRRRRPGEKVTDATPRSARKISHRQRVRVSCSPIQASGACMLRHTALALFGAAALVSTQWTSVFAQDKPPGTVRPSVTERPAAKPAVGVLGSCRAVTVCRDARPLGDFGPPRRTCQKNTICDSNRASSIR